MHWLGVETARSGAVVRIERAAISHLGNRKRVEAVAGYVPDNFADAGLVYTGPSLPNFAGPTSESDRLVERRSYAEPIPRIIWTNDFSIENFNWLNCCNAVKFSSVTEQSRARDSNSACKC